MYTQTHKKENTLNKLMWYHFWGRVNQNILKLIFHIHELFQTKENIKKYLQFLSKFNSTTNINETKIILIYFNPNTRKQVDQNVMV